MKILAKLVTSDNTYIQHPAIGLIQVHEWSNRGLPQKRQVTFQRITEDGEVKASVHVDSPLFEVAPNVGNRAQQDAAWTVLQFDHAELVRTQKMKISVPMDYIVIDPANLPEIRQDTQGTLFAGESIVTTDRDLDRVRKRAYLWLAAVRFLEAAKAAEVTKRLAMAKRLYRAAGGADDRALDVGGSLREKWLAVADEAMAAIQADELEGSD